jgi:hypothetical protein
MPLITHSDKDKGNARNTTRELISFQTREHAETGEEQNTTKWRLGEKTITK